MPPKKKPKKDESESESDAFESSSEDESSEDGPSEDDGAGGDEDEDDADVIPDSPTPASHKKAGGAGAAAGGGDTTGKKPAGGRKGAAGDSLGQLALSASASKKPASTPVSKKRKLVIESDEKNTQPYDEESPASKPKPAKAASRNGSAANSSSENGSELGSPPPSAKKPKAVAPGAAASAVAAAAAPAPASPAQAAAAAAGGGAGSPVGTGAASGPIDITRGGEVGTLQHAIKLLLQYFKQQNRPYNQQQLFDNFHKRISKSLLDQALEERNHAKLEIKVKVYGKAKIYYPDQSKMPVHASAAELEQLDREIAKTEQLVINLQQRERQALAAAAALKAEPSDKDIDAELAALEARVRDKSARAAKLSGVVVDPQALRNAVLEHNFYRQHWATRKRNVMDLIKELASGMEKKVKEVVELIGIETDEEAKCEVPKPMPDVPP